MSEVSNLTQVQGRAFTGDLREQAARIKSSEKSGIYAVYSQGVANLQSDFDVNDDDATFFPKLQQSRINFCQIFTDKEITVKFRTRQNTGIVVGSLDAITIRANTLRTIDFIADITNIFITNSSGSTANLIIEAI